MAELTDYTALITSQHRDKPRFAATVAAVVQPLVDQMNVLQSMPDKFDLDNDLGWHTVKSIEDASAGACARARLVNDPLSGDGRVRAA